MIPILQLIRWKNLLIVAATQYLMRWCVIYPTIEFKYNPVFLDNFGKKLSLQLGEGYFFLLVMATMCITAAGYVINDYFDQKNDIINRPQSVVLGKYISPRTAMALHWSLTLLGILLGTIVSYHIGYLNLSLIFVFASGLLWFYSTDFNRKLLIGNLIVAFLTALVPFLVAIFEIIPLNLVYRNGLRLLYLNFNGVFFWILAFSYFAFITTFIREIVKDMQDYIGDKAFGSNSLPITVGIKTTKAIVIGLIGLLIASILVGMFVYIPHTSSSLYLVCAIIVPSIFAAFKIFKAETVKDFGFVSSVLKVIMILGTLYSVILFFITKGSI